MRRGLVVLTLLCLAACSDEPEPPTFEESLEIGLYCERDLGLAYHTEDYDYCAESKLKEIRGED